MEPQNISHGNSWNLEIYLMEIHGTSKYISWKFMKPQNISHGKSWNLEKYLMEIHGTPKFIIEVRYFTRFTRVHPVFESVRRLRLWKLKNWKSCFHNIYNPDQLLSQRSYRSDLLVLQGPSASLHRAGFVSITQKHLTLTNMGKTHIYRRYLHITSQGSG